MEFLSRLPGWGGLVGLGLDPQVHYEPTRRGHYEPTRPARYPILAAMLRAARRNAAAAFTAPGPRVDFAHAAPRSGQTFSICGMFGQGTPPTPARPNWARYRFLTRIAACKEAG